MFIEWENLPRKTMSSGALFFNKEGKFIITKPNYKEGWNVPGGMVDLQESPSEAFEREVKEELGLEKKPVCLLGFDYVKERENRKQHDHVVFVFDGGVLTDEEIHGIKLQEEELIEYRFVSLEEARGLLEKDFARRLPKCIEARNAHKVVYLENGEEIFQRSE
jgi:8-oxo-dGTP diphosphatase